MGENTNNQSLGEMIGSVSHTFSITNDAKDKVRLTIEVDFSTASDVDIKGWLVSNRVIAGQRPWRKLSKEGLKDLDGEVFVAQSIGQKVKSRTEKAQDLINAGIPKDLAGFAVDNPAKFKEIMEACKSQVE